MSDFLKIFSKIKNVLVFIILEIISIVIINNNSVFQRSVFVEKTMQFSSFVYAQTNKITDYLALKSTNDELVKYNTQLQMEIDKLKSQYYVVGDSVRGDLDSINGRFVSANIISKQIGNIDNHFIIDKGLNDGLSDGLGVVSNGNVIGFIRYISDDYSVVLLAISSKLKISAKIKSNNYLCVAYWDNISVDYGYIDNIPKHITVNKGDTILTSGYSSIFPKDYIIGTVEETQHNKTTGANNFKIKYAADFMKVDFVDVYMVKNIEEINSIKSMIKEEE